MRKGRVVVMALLLTLGVMLLSSGALLAEEPTVKEERFSQEEWIPGPDGTLQPMEVDYVAHEASQNVALPDSLAAEGASANVVVTMRRALLFAWVDHWNHRAWAKGHTRTDQCVGKLTVRIEHWYWSANHGEVPRSWDYNDSGPFARCHNHSGDAVTFHDTLFANGTTHEARGYHKALINGEWHDWPDQRGPRERR